MTPTQEHKIKRKLPDLLFSMMSEDETVVHRLIMCIDGNNSHTVLLILNGTYFPNQRELVKICEIFSLSYSTLKTWRLHKTN